MIRFVAVRWTFEGWHRWPEAPGSRAYLRAKHRHLFHAELQLEVEGNDREIEFHDLRDFCVQVTSEFGKELGSASCEMLAGDILQKVNERFGRKRSVVKVFEDGENGSVIRQI